MDFAQRDALIAEAPDVFYLKEHYQGYPCVLVRLSRVNADVLRDLLGMSWKFLTETRTHKGTKT